MKQWRFRLFDTGFFRDGTPFAFGETGALHQNSTFPPLMTTLQGAIRTSLARFQGWEVGKAQRDKILLFDIWDRQVLGDAKSLGRLRLKGPYLEWDGQRLYPLPRTLLFDQKNQPVGWLVPGKQLESDLGNKRFLKSTVPKGKLLEAWVTREGLVAVLNQQYPKQSDIFRPVQLWMEEKRVGIKRDSHTHQTVEGHLYTSSHIRPNAKLRICVEVEDVPADWKVPARFTTPLGGEGRFAEVTVGESQSSLPDFPDFSLAQKTIRFTISLLTSLAISKENNETQKGPLKGMNCLTASLGRSFSLGGWDLSQNKPRPLQPMSPVGSTWYYEADPAIIPTLKKLHGTCVGENSTYGFGQVCIGRWEETDE